MKAVGRVRCFLLCWAVAFGFLLPMPATANPNDEAWFSHWVGLLEPNEKTLLDDAIAYKTIVFQFQANHPSVQGAIDSFKELYGDSPFATNLQRIELVLKYRSSGLEAIDFNNTKVDSILFLINSIKVAEGSTPDEKATCFEKAMTDLGFGKKAKQLLPSLLGFYENELYKTKAYLGTLLREGRPASYHNLLARLFFEAELYDKSLLAYRVLGGGKPSPEQRYYIGMCLHYMGRHPSAAKVLGRLLEPKETKGSLSSNMVRELRLKYASSLEASGHPKKALAFLEKEVQVRPSTPLYRKLLQLALNHHPNHRYTSLLNRYLSSHPRTYVAYLHERLLGIELLTKGQSSKGMQALQNAYAQRRPNTYAFLSAYVGGAANLKAFYTTNKDVLYDYLIESYLCKTNTSLNVLRETFVGNDQGIVRLLPKSPEKLAEIRFPLGVENDPAKTTYWTNKDKWMKSYYEKEFDDGALVRMQHLVALGYGREAQMELRRQHPNPNDEPNRLHHDKFLQLASSRSNRSIQQHMLRVESYGPSKSSLPHDFLQQAYPTYRYEYVAYLSKMYNVPTSLIYAVMREESHFNPQATSKVGAVGLMQIMPDTGERLFRSSKLNRYYDYDLYDEELNIHLGVVYLSDLMKAFEGNVHRVLAAYNGGPRSVRRWLKNKRRQEDDLFFALTVPYVETEAYVQKVMRSYVVYESLYLF